MEFEHASQIIEVAATAAVHGSPLSRIPNRPIRTHVEWYWQSSKCRQGHWATALSLIERRTERGPQTVSHRWNQRAEGLIEEILACDVFAQSVLAHDQRSGSTLVVGTGVLFPECYAGSV